MNDEIAGAIFSLIFRNKSPTGKYRSASFALTVGKQVVETIQCGGENLLPIIQHLWREMENTEIFMALKEDMRVYIISQLDPEKLGVLLQVMGRVLDSLQEDLAPLRNNPALLRAAILTLRTMNSVLNYDFYISLFYLIFLVFSLFTYQGHAYFY